MTYATEQELIDYAAARAVTLTGDPGVLLTKAGDWLEVQPIAFTDDPVPEAIKKAQMVAAILIDGGEDLLAPQGQRVLSESVAGAVSVTYSDNGRQATFYPQLFALLKPFMVGGGGSVFEVRRG